MAGADQDGNHVGQVVFARRVIGADFVDVFPEEIGVVAENTRVNFADSGLLRRTGFLFHDFLNMAFGIADDASVAGWVGDFGGDYGCRGAAGTLKFGQALQSFGADERTVSDGDDEAATE